MSSLYQQKIVCIYFVMMMMILIQLEIIQIQTNERKASCKRWCLEVNQLITNHYYLKCKGIFSVNGQSSAWLRVRSHINKKL